MIIETATPQSGQELDSKPLPDKNAIMAALQTLFCPGDVVELRAIKKRGGKQVSAGYFDADHWHELAEQAAAMSLNGAAVYVTLNPVEPQLLSRHPNRVEPYAKNLTLDSQILRRRLLLIDLDPIRPSDTSATDLQLSAARTKALEINGYLLGLGWPMPVLAESGNGYHLLFSIDLPNDQSSTALIKGVLMALARRFDDAMIEVDQTVYNSARICKLYGTVANKGTNTPAMPWRLAKILYIPKQRIAVTISQLESVLPALNVSTGQVQQTQEAIQSIAPRNNNFNLEELLNRSGLKFQVGPHDGKERFKLATCPFNPEHVNGEAAIFREASGKLGFKCQHASCASRHWQDVRDLLDGPRFRRVVNESSLAPAENPDQSTTATDSTPSSWPEPTPLPDELPPVDAFYAELLPAALRPHVMDIAHRMQCPPDFPATAVIIAISSLIGPRAVVQPKVLDEWRVTPNLWGFIVGRPGVKKSPALGEALQPLRRLQEDEFASAKAAHDTWKIDVKVANMLGESNEKKAKGLAVEDPFAARALLAPIETPPEPTARRYIVNDATVEKLGEILQKNTWGTLAFRDEVYNLLTSLDKQGQEDARGFYLQGYDGDKSYTVDRIGRGTVHIPRLCLSMLGGIQPGHIQEYVRDAVAGGSADDGLLQRFGLAIWPDLNGNYVHVDQKPDAEARQAAWSVFDRLATLQPATDTEPVVWRFDDAAQAHFVEWLIGLENEIRGNGLHPAMVSHLAKYRKLIPALSLIFALIDTPESGGLIGEPELLRALSWYSYLRTHANRLYSAAVIPDTTNSTTILNRIRDGKLTGKGGAALASFTPRQLAVKNWSGLGTPEAVRKAADLLVDYDWLRKETIASGAAGGRPSERYLINPALLKNAAI